MAGFMSGRTAVVTGAAHPQGIGWAIAQRLALEGGQVWVFDLDVEENLDDLPHGMRGVVCDVADVDSVAAALATVLEHANAIDVLVNNAGVARGGADFLATSAQDWQASINVNLLGVVNICQAAIPHMGKGSAIINVASLAGLGAIDGIPACYSATKFAVVGLSKQLALELAPQAITCNALCPGSIDTQMHQQTLQQISAEMGVDLAAAQDIENRGIPLGYTAQPQTVADVACFLASPAGSYITGVALPVAGGMAPGL